MTLFNKIVTLNSSDYSNIDIICKHFKISELTAKVLLNRGISTIKEIESFLYPSIDKLFDPYLLNDMDEAVERIVKAIKKGENIWIYGDYDVDGVTSTSILKIFFKSLGINVNYYIPDRMTEGYGLNKEAIDCIHKEGGNLVITVDCGITSIEEVYHCNQLGIDIIVTDHHQCGDTLPDAIAVINPNRKDIRYPFKELAGVGVAFKLIQALSKALSVEIDYNELLPIIAIGTVADVVPLIGENRIIVKNGLDLINNCKNYGVQALIDVSGLKDKKITSGHIGFVIGPRINATGRIGLAKYAVELLTTDNREEAFELAKKLNKENAERQSIEKEILEEAENIIKANIDIEKEKVFVVASENWHPGVIGIVSSRITDKYYRPSIVITVEEDKAKGSARSIPSFDIYEALSKCKDLFINFGGHKQAAGLSLNVENIKLLRERINNVANQFLDDEDLIPEIKVDCEIQAENITLETIRELYSLEPFGMNNPKPEFLMKNVKVKSIKQVGNDNKHLKLTIESDGVEIDSIGFNLGELFSSIMPNDSIDIICGLEINNFLNEEKPQLLVKEIMIGNNENINIIDEYYNSLKNVLKNYHQEYTLSKNINFSQFENNRLKVIINELKNDNRTLILVNNYNNLNWIIKELRLIGRELIKKTSICYQTDDKSKKNCILVNPDIKNIDYEWYDDIIIFDFSFSVYYIDFLIELLIDKKCSFKRLFTEQDIEDNVKVLEDLVPSVNELRLVYKTLTSFNTNPFKIETKKFVHFLHEKQNTSINSMKLVATFDILKEGKILDYKIKNGMCYIKLLEKPKDKVKIESLLSYRILNETKKNLKNLAKCYFNK